MRAGVVRVVKLDDLEAAFVHIEVNVALLKVRCMGFPHFCFWIAFFDGKPSFKANALTMESWRDKEELQPC